MKILLMTAASLGLAVSAAHAAEPAHDNGERMFAMIDANGDGKIDKAELTRAAEAQAAKKGDTKPVDTAKIDEMIKRIDSNGDGAVDRAEMAAMRKAAAGAGEAKQ